MCVCVRACVRACVCVCGVCLLFVTTTDGWQCFHVCSSLQLFVYVRIVFVGDGS